MKRTKPSTQKSLAVLSSTELASVTGGGIGDPIAPVTGPVIKPVEPVPYTGVGGSWYSNGTSCVKKELADKVVEL